jgi:hypothetical protein
LAGVLVASTMAPAPSAARDRSHLKRGHYTVSSFNVLGANHTPRGGKRASGIRRIGWAYQLLVRHHVDVAGFQELQVPQLRRLRAITRGTWAFYPGLRLESLDAENSVGWRTDRFTFVRGTTVKIPYLGGRPRRMPLVLLREKDSGMLTYFANYHNPAETGKHRNQGRWRRAATRIEIALQNQIVGQGIPRIVTGDMNERGSYFCRVTARAPLKAARPNTIWRDGVCRPHKPRSVDWILGSLRVRFSNYVEDRSPLVDRTTDHPVIVTDVTVRPESLPNGWQLRTPAPIRPRIHF